MSSTNGNGPCLHDGPCPGKDPAHYGTCPCPHATDCRMECENCEHIEELAAKSREVEDLKGLLGELWTFCGNDVRGDANSIGLGARIRAKIGGGA